jgi:LysM repeat protein
MPRTLTKHLCSAIALLLFAPTLACASGVSASSEAIIQQQPQQDADTTADSATVGTARDTLLPQRSSDPPSGDTISSDTSAAPSSEESSAEGTPARMTRQMNTVQGGDESSPSQSGGEPSSSEQRTFYTIKEGDTLYEISQRFGISVERLKYLNNLNDNIIDEGKVLRLRSSDRSQASSGGSDPMARQQRGARAGDAQPSRSSSRPSRTQTSRSQNPTSRSAGSRSTGSQSQESQPYDGAVPQRFSENSPTYEKIRRAATEYRQTDRASVVSVAEDRSVYPYGKEIPIVKTPLLHFSTVKLARNEYATSMSIGDQKRWEVTTGTMGTKGNYQQMVYIKPQRCGPMRTNLLVTTNKNRTYQMVLKALPCEVEEGQRRPSVGQWDRTISFYYPDGRSVGPSNISSDVRPPRPASRPSPSPPRNSDAPQARRGTGSSSGDTPERGGSPPMQSSPPGGGSSSSSLTVPPRPEQSGKTSRYKSDRGGASSVDLRTLETGKYDIQVDRDFPCEPDMVGDDGERTYIRLGSGPECSTVYPYYILSDRGQRRLGNYSVFDGSTYVAEGVHEEAALLYRNSQGETSQVTITNTNMGDDRR